MVTQAEKERQTDDNRQRPTNRARQTETVTFVVMSLWLVLLPT